MGSVLSSICGCIKLWPTLEPGYLITTDGNPIVDDQGEPITVQSFSNMEINQLEELEGETFPAGSSIPVDVPIGGGEYKTYRINLSGSQGFMRYIDVPATGTDTIEDERIVDKEIKGISYETAFLNPTNFTQNGNTITSPLIDGLSTSVVIRLYF